MLQSALRLSPDSDFFIMDSSWLLDLPLRLFYFTQPFFFWFPEAFLDLRFFFFASMQKNGSFWSSDVVAQLGLAACGLRDSWVASSWCKTNTKRLSGETRADTSVCMTISWSGVISCCVCWRQEMTPKLPKYKHLSFSLSHVLVNWIYLGFWLLVRQKKDCENI